MAFLLPEAIEGTALLAEGAEAGTVAEGTAGASSGGLLSGIGNIIKSPINLIGGLFGLQLVGDTLKGGTELQDLSNIPSGLIGATNSILSVVQNPLIMGGLAVLLVVLLLRR